MKKLANILVIAGLSVILYGAYQYHILSVSNAEEQATNSWLTWTIIGSACAFIGVLAKRSTRLTPNLFLGIATLSMLLGGYKYIQLSKDRDENQALKVWAMWSILGVISFIVGWLIKQADSKELEEEEKGK